jgi:hypothetical protein
MPLIGAHALHQQKYRIITASLAVALLASTLSPLAATVSADAIAATDHSNAVSTGEVRQALQYTSGVLSDSSTTATTSDNDSALVAATAGATIDVPKDASEGVTLSNPNGPSLDIALPNADQSGSGQQVAPGVVAYASNDGSANAVQATEDGGVRMLTVIDNPNAPTKYDYKISVPEGGTIQIIQDGSAIVLDANGQVLATVATPWAKDARGKQIRTWFTTDDTTLTQHVKHNVRGVVYPVTADPSFNWSWTGVTIYFNKTETRFISGLTFATLAGYLGLAGGAGAAVAGVGYTADYAIQHASLCLAVFKPYVGSSIIGWIYRC